MNGLERLSRRHLRAGWWFLLAYLLMGIFLETLHGFKVQWYLNTARETRRLLWTLAHAHGTLLSLIQIAYALSIRHLGTSTRFLNVASPLLLGATILLPMGFFVGGTVVYGSDPGLGILLVPLGALLLLVGVLFVALRTSSAQDSESGGSGS